jgi:hypothetical protein
VGFTKSGHTDIQTDRQMRSKPEVAPQHPRVVIQLKTKMYCWSVMHRQCSMNSAECYQGKDSFLWQVQIASCLSSNQSINCNIW